jgi:hypothetical protein
MFLIAGIRIRLYWVCILLFAAFVAGRLSPLFFSNTPHPVNPVTLEMLR